MAETNVKFDIDAVITWVDGDDPVHTAKRRAYSGTGDVMRQDDIGGATRFRSVGEIRFCVASILRFAPFIRRIFIVTDAQNPNLDGFVSRHFPDSRIPVIIVDHRELFCGYEQYLPTFNSLSIETMLYRIPGLSEHFVYFNDDVFLTAPMTPQDFYEEGKPVVYGYWHNTFTAVLAKWFRRSRNGHKPFTYKDSMLNAALTLRGKALWRFFRIVHTSFALKKSVFEAFYDAHPDVLEHNMSFRFRDASQYNPQCLFITMLAGRGECVVRSDKGMIMYMQPAPGREEKLARLLDRYKRDTTARFCCVNSLDQGNAEQQREIVEWIGSRLGIDFTEED